MAKARTKKAKPAEDEDSPDMDFSHLVSAEDIKSERITWCWTGRILANSLNLIDGNKGVGKSSLLARMAATISNGLKFPGERNPCRKGGVLWFAEEESKGAAVRPRFIGSGGKVNQLKFWPNSSLEPEQRIYLPYSRAYLVGLLKHMKASSIVLDPWLSLAGGLMDTSSDTATRAYLECLASVCDEAKVTALMVRHLNKGKATNILNRGMGSAAIAATCRVVMAADPVPGAKHEGYLSTVVTNYGSAAPPLHYYLRDNGDHTANVEWGKETNLTLDQILEGAEDEGDVDERADAEKFLRELLKESEVWAKVVQEEAQKSGLGFRTVRKMKAKLKVPSIKRKVGAEVRWYWASVKRWKS